MRIPRPRPLLLSVLPLATLVSYLLFLFARPSTSDATTGTLVHGPLTVWWDYEGNVDARNVIFIMSRFRGNATVVELAPEGRKVSKGDLLVRFDSSALERQVLQLERDCALAEAELESTEHAQLPLELRDLEIERMEIGTTLRAEERYLEESIKLAEEDLVSEKEIEHQTLKVEEIRTQYKTAEQRLRLTRDYLHPAALKRARAEMSSAVQELELAREQLRNTVVLAPADGIAVYKPLHMGGEFRTIRVGDSVYPNQPFMVLPDVSDLVVHCEIPEGELSRVQEGRRAFIHPLAYPDRQVPGVIESVSSTAQSLPERPGWQKFFHVVIGLEHLDPVLRPGMTVTAHILSYHNPDALLIPRTAVTWNDGKPFATIVEGTTKLTRPLELGMADDKSFEVVSGLSSGDNIVIQ